MKRVIRQKILKKRDALSSLKRDELSDKIWGNLTETPGFLNARSVLIYASFNGEVRTDGMIKQLLRRNVRVFLPFIDKGAMSAKEVFELPDSDNKKLGIRQPPATNPTVALPDIDCVVIPAIAFDLNGHRVGFGAGYYDRYLENVNSTTLLIGIAYSFQIIEKIEDSPHDVPVNYIATEKQIISCPLV